jgi:MFS transporter, DHA2 family, methylenomycin A resistance protein
LDFCGLLFIGPGTPIGITLTALVPIGFGAGLTSPPVTTTLLQAVAIEHAGAASGVLGVVRQVGGVLGVATFGAFVAVNFNMGMRLSLIIAIVSLLITAMLSFNFVRPVP